MAECWNCRREISFRILQDKKVPVDQGTGQRHRCDEDVYGLPQWRRVSMFVPKTDKYKKR